MVGASKTEAGSGRVIPLNERAPMTLQTWATNFSAREPEHSVFPSEHYGLAGNDRTVHAKTSDPNTAIGDQGRVGISEERGQRLVPFS